MGGIRKFKHKPKKRDSRRENKETSGERVAFQPLLKESVSFETYYKAQNIVPETEWDCFLNILKQDLPTAFRISACNEKEAETLLNVVEGSLFKDLINPDDPEEQKKKPFCLPWYPKRLGWQVPLSRKDIRRSETYFRLHNFLMSETDSGNISRQEVVSMIPPLVLDVQPHHKVNGKALVDQIRHTPKILHTAPVLDMCAAPGSKTAQLIEMMHSEDKVPSGVVLANDVDNSRCYMLVHQAKRLNSPCTIITNHDASVLPNLLLKSPDGISNILKFDRVLCDVPCTGDGTLRKNADIWKKWNPINANNLHGVQRRILKRGLELLTVGGRLVYSTCSFNPVENEAVLHRVIAESEGALELQDVSETLPGLKYNPGLSFWVLASKEMEIFKSFDEVPESLHSQFTQYMFPPKPEDVDKYHLNRCIRVLPHQQDSGGFFVAVLKKLSLLPWESTKSSEVMGVEAEEKKKPNVHQAKRRKIQGYREDPFVFFKEDEPVWPIIRDFYKMKSDMPLDCLLTRCEAGKKKNIYFVSPVVRDIIIHNQDRIKLINAGVKTFSRCDNKNVEHCFRLAQEGLASIAPYVGEGRIVQVAKTDLLQMLTNCDPKNPTDTLLLEEETQKKLEHITQGSCMLQYRGENGLNLDLVGWRGTRSVRVYVPLPDCVHFIRLLGGDTSVFEKNKFKKDEACNDPNLSMLNEGASNSEEHTSEMKEETNQVKEEMTISANAENGDCSVKEGTG